MKSPTKPVVEDLPVIETVGFEQTAKGWVVVVARLQGSRVLSRDVVGEPANKQNGVELLRITIAKRLILGLKDS